MDYRKIDQWEGVVVKKFDENDDTITNELTPELLSPMLSQGINIVNSPFQNKKFASSTRLMDDSPLTLE